jgi:hypothetical protein
VDVSGALDRVISWVEILPMTLREIIAKEARMEEILTTIALGYLILILLGFIVSYSIWRFF